MFIRKLIITNWKNFADASVTLGERVFLVGPNASGKSNLMDVFRFLRDIAREGGGLQEAVRLRGGISKIRCLSARGNNTDVKIEIHLADMKNANPIWKYELVLTQKGGGAVSETRAVIRSEKVWKADTLIHKRPNESDKNDETLLQYTHLEQPTSNAGFRAMAEFFKAIDYQHIIPQIIRNPMLFQKHYSSEDFYGRELFEKMNKMPKKTRDSQLRKIEKALRNAVPNLKNLTLEKDKAGIPHLQAIYEHWRPHGARQNEEQFSDGTLRLIGLFYAMLNGQETLLLEEPELSLHSGVVQNMAEIIHFMQKRKSGKRQVILSTHSYDLLNTNSISSEEIILLKPTSKGTEVALADDINEVKSLLETGLTPADVVLPYTKAPNAEQLCLSFME